MKLIQDQRHAMIDPQLNQYLLQGCFIRGNQAVCLLPAVDLTSKS